MELGQAEFRPQRFGGALAQFGDLERADLVAQRLARPHHVAFDLALGQRFRIPQRIAVILDRLLARPALGVHAGVDHQPRRAQHLVVQVAEIIFRLVEQAHLLAQRFRIQRPAFRVGIVAAELAEVRQVQFLQQRDVEVVSRLAFMQEQRHHAGAAVLGRVVHHGPEHARTRAVGGRRGVMVGRGGAAQFRFQAQVQRRLWHQRKQRRQLGAQYRVELAVDVDHFLFCLERAVFVLQCNPARQAVGGTRVTHLRAHDCKLLLDARHFLEADRVDLVRRQAGGGLLGHGALVPIGAAGQRAPAGAGARRWQVVFFHEPSQARQRRRQFGGDGAAVGARQRLPVIGAKSGRHLADRGVEDARFRRRAKQLAVLRQRHGHRRLLHHDPLAHPDPHVGNGLVDPRRQLVQAVQVSPVFLHRGQALARFAAGEVGQRDRHVGHLVDRQQVLGDVGE